MIEIILIIIALLMLALGFCWLAAKAAVAPPRASPNMTPYHFDLAYENISFSSINNFQIDGWLIFVENPKGVIIVCHGYPAERSTMLTAAKMLGKAGFCTLLFDFRAMGKSGGKYTTIGYMEPSDIQSAVDFIKLRDDLRQLPIGVFGESMGGASALMATARDTRIQAVWADSPFAALHEAAQKWLTNDYTRWLRWSIAPVMFFGKLISGVPINKVRPIDEIEKISPKPIYLVAGTGDKLMPHEHSIRLFNKAKEPKSLWLIDGIGHVQGRTEMPVEYEARLNDFFIKALSENSHKETMNNTGVLQ